MNWVLLGFHEYTSIQFCLWVFFSLLRFFFKFPWFLFVFFLRFQLIFFLTNSALTRSFLLYFFLFLFSVLCFPIRLDCVGLGLYGWGVLFLFFFHFLIFFLLGGRRTSEPTKDIHLRGGHRQAVDVINDRRIQVDVEMIESWWPGWPRAAEPSCFFFSLSLSLFQRRWPSATLFQKKK